MAKTVPQVAPTRLSETKVNSLPQTMRSDIERAKRTDHMNAIKELLGDLSKSDSMPRDLKKVEITTGNAWGSDLTLFFKTRCSNLNNFDSITLPQMEGTGGGAFAQILPRLGTAVNYLTASDDSPVRMVLADVNYYMVPAKGSFLGSASDPCRFTDEGIIVARLFSKVSEEEYSKFPSGLKGMFEPMRTELARIFERNPQPILEQTILVFSTNKKYDDGAAAVAQALEGLEFKNVALSVLNPEDASAERHFKPLKNRIEDLEIALKLALEENERLKRIK